MGLCGVGRVQRVMGDLKVEGEGMGIQIRCGWWGVVRKDEVGDL